MRKALTPVFDGLGTDPLQALDHFIEGYLRESGVRAAQHAIMREGRLVFPMSPQVGGVEGTNDAAPAEP